MSVSPARVSEMALALLTTMSMPPKWAAVRSIASLTAPSSRTSTASASARPPAASMSAAAVWMVPGSFGWGVSVFAAIATLAPSRAARNATASPIPREAPVMKSVLPLRDMWDSVRWVERQRNPSDLPAVRPTAGFAALNPPYNTPSHVQPVERLFVLDSLQAIEQRHHPVAAEALRQQQEFLAQLGTGHRPLRGSLEARHLAGHFATV